MTDPRSDSQPDDATLAPSAPARSTRLLAVGVLLIVLAAGVIGGIALDRTVLRTRMSERSEFRGDRRQGPRRPSDMLGAELKLSEDQRVRIDTVIERQMRGFREIRKSTQPAIDSLMAQTRRGIDSILTPEQRVQLDAARAKREAEFKKRFPNGVPRGGPGDWGRGSMGRP
jgi:Spy/CpxP family protein refolding chaperone